MAERQLPKLNVAGSIPVSRSIKSTTYKESAKFLLRLATMTNLRIKHHNFVPLRAVWDE